MYLEAGPVIETPLAAAQAVHEMLLQSWGETLRVFPAIPAAWKEVAFRDLRGEGAFLVSAARHDGRTTYVRVTSLAGEPATLRVQMSNPQISPPAAAERTGDGVYRLRLRKGEAVTLGDGAIGPVPAEPGKVNRFGLP
jgi:alpha-L-fucosidase 2